MADITKWAKPLPLLIIHAKDEQSSARFSNEYNWFIPPDGYILFHYGSYVLDTRDIRKIERWCYISPLNIMDSDYIIDLCRRNSYDF